MADNITCPRCKTQQPGSAGSGRCASCGLDFKAYAEHVRKKRAGREGRSVRCPYCKTEQPLRALCMKCGLDFRTYSDYLKRKKAGQDVRPPRPPAPVVAPGPPGQMEASTSADGATRPMELEDLFKQTWEVFKNRWLTLIVLNVLYIAAIVVSILPVMVIVPLLSTDPDPITIAAVASLYLIAVIAIAIVTLGSMFAAASDETLSIGGSIAAAFGKALSFIWVMVLQGFIVFGGFLLFIVPGFIFMTWFSFAPYMVFSEDARGMGALLKSKEYVRGHGWDVFFKLVVIWVVYMVASSVPLIGPLVCFPFMILYIAAMYRDMARVKGLDTPYPADRWARLKWPMVGFAGYMAPVVAVIAILIPLIGTLKGLDTEHLAEIMPSPGTLQSATTLRTGKDVYRADEDITVHYSGMPGNAQDWITVVGALAPEDSYGEYYYTEGRAAGDMEFNGLTPGRYEARAFHDWPNGGYSIKARRAFVVEAAGPGGRPRLMLGAEDYYPGDEISVRFSVPPDFTSYAWAGIVSSALPHGNEKLNRDNTSVFQLLGGRTSGDLSFTAPLEPGSYDVRLHDREGGVEVAHVSFIVSDDSPPRSVRVRASSDRPIKVMVQLSSLGYEAEVALGQKVLYTIPGERDTNYDHTILVNLISGENVLTISHDSLPGAGRTHMRIRVYRPLPGGGEKELARWSVSSPSGTRSLTIIVEGAGVKA